MKKYSVHFLYLLVIIALAVASRIKTNELQTRLTAAETRAVEAEKRAEMSRMEAEAQAEHARQMLEQAQRQLFPPNKPIPNP